MPYIVSDKASVKKDNNITSFFLHVLSIELVSSVSIKCSRRVA